MRHPGAARAERALRKQRALVHERFDNKREGTPETHEAARRRSQGALARLYASGAIDADQLAAAVEIAGVAERIQADVSIKTASLETRIDAGRLRDDKLYERLRHVRHEYAYHDWRREVAGLGPIGAVLDMLVGEPDGFTVVARRYRMHNRRAKALLLAALSAWPEHLRSAYRMVSQEQLDAAHARLAR